MSINHICALYLIGKIAITLAHISSESLMVIY